MNRGFQILDFNRSKYPPRGLRQCPGGPASSRGPNLQGDPRERAPRGGCPLGTPLALSVRPGVSASQARSRLLFSLRPQGGGWEEGGGGARLPPGLGRLGPGTVHPGMGPMPPEAGGMRGPPNASLAPLPLPFPQVPRSWARAGRGPAGPGAGRRAGVRCRAVAPAAARALAARGRDAMTHPLGIRTLHLLLIDTPQTADLARPRSPSLLREGREEKSYLEWKLLIGSVKEEFYFAHSFIIPTTNCRSRELSLAQGIPRFSEALTPTRPYFTCLLNMSNKFVSCEFMKYSPRICSNWVRRKPTEFRERMFLADFLYLLKPSNSNHKIYLGGEAYTGKTLQISNKSKVCLRVFFFN